VSSPNRLTDDRLARIEQGALERCTLLDRVVIELVEEIWRLRQISGERSAYEPETLELHPNPLDHPGDTRPATALTSRRM
jgi:hypothetical protein